MGSWGPIPGCFVLSSRPFGTCFIKPSTRLLADSFSCCLVLGFGSHVTRLICSLVVRWLRPPSLALDVWFFFHADSWFRLARVLSRSFVSSRLTANFWSSSSTSCFFRAALGATSSGLFLQLHLLVVYCDVACGWSLQHSSVEICYDVVAGPAPMR